MHVSVQGAWAAFLNQGGSWLGFVIPYRRHSGGRTQKRSKTRRFGYRIRKRYRGAGLGGMTQFPAGWRQSVHSARERLVNYLLQIRQENAS